MRFRGRVLAAVLLAAAIPGAGARAAPFSDMFVFGDSLVDTGNVSLLTAGLLPDPGQPYAPGRFSNGPLWVDHLAAGLGLPAGATPFLSGGNNYGFAGATTGVEFVPPGLVVQAVLHSFDQGAADPGALYVVTAGANDLRAARGAESTAESRQAAAEAAALNVVGTVANLASQGARSVLLTNAPDLGLTPEAAALGLAAQSTDVSMRYNAVLAAFEAPLEALVPGLDIDLLSLFDWSVALYQDAVANAGAVFGLTNATSPCAGFTGSSGAPCEVSLFSDDLHPSAAAHGLFGQVALELVQTPEPAPAEMLMVADWSLDGLLPDAGQLLVARQAAALVLADAEPVPEPASAALLGGALLAGLAVRRRVRGS